MGKQVIIPLGLCVSLACLCLQPHLLLSSCKEHSLRWSNCLLILLSFLQKNSTLNTQVKKVGASSETFAHFWVLVVGVAKKKVNRLP